MGERALSEELVRLRLFLQAAGVDISRAAGVLWENGSQSKNLTERIVPCICP